MSDRDPLADAKIVAFPKSADERTKKVADKYIKPDGSDPEKAAEGLSPSDKGGAGGGSAGGDDGDIHGIVPKLNEEYALVVMGQRTVVIREMPSAPIADRVKILSIDAFTTYHLNRYTTVVTESEDGPPKTRRVNWAPLWMRSKKRRTFDGVEFFPDPLMRPGTDRYFNLWRGFDLEPGCRTPKDGPCAYKTFRDHLLTNICNGEPDLFTWVFGWFAQIVQFPRERIETALVLRGKMGSGKTKIGEVFGSLFSSHYFLVDDPRYVTGQFNAHMASCLLLQVDEGFWAGDKAAEGRLKGLVSAKTQMIEAKGIDPIRLVNYVRLLFSSNENWVVPAGMDERRFAVLDVAPHAAQNLDYFAEMDRELADGGRAALLADLFAFDVASVQLRKIPKTGALLEQKLRSLDPVTSWWYERLSDGTTTRRASQWYTPCPIVTLYNDYLHNADRIGIRRKADESTFGMQMRKLLPGLKRERRFADIEVRGDDNRITTERKRAWVYLLPKLAQCRALFEAALQQTIEWDDEGEDGAPDDVAHDNEADRY